ncbi:MAG: sigma-54-dependent Fis family transcriptional regulator [Deltaproteobacteria bacterium]|nr:sigma-54-dependent Fis family transcriptional regulator [Deltaproteobacteria bacterium]
MLSILLADDEPLIRMAVSDALRARGHKVIAVSDGAEALAVAESRVLDLVICDIRLPSLDGLSVFRRIRERTPKTEVVLITGFGSFSDAVAVIKEGAYDYITKPFEVQEIVMAVERITERRDLRRDLDAALAALASKGSGALLVGHTPAMLRLQERIDAIADSSASVLISAESGTGKELVARAIHDRSPRRDKAFVAVNCAAFPEALIEAELFGHERGAFTGALGRRDGRFKLADGGTLLFDEVGELPLPAQAKLLRVLQEGTFEPIGSNTSTQVDVRLISTTNRNLKTEVAEGRFREDLYYRINVLEIRIPPLRERRGDIPMLAEHFLRRFYNGPGDPPSVSPAVRAALERHDFPGNVREFMHAIEHALVFCRGRELRLQDLPPDICGGTLEPTSEQSVRPLSVAMKEFEREYLLRTLEAAKGKRAQAAELLGISRKNLWEKLRQHGVSAADIES